MKRNEVFGYIRVSDTKQIDGASLSAQQKAIEEYALKNHLNIIRWFEETKTAAKRGRPKFTEMLSLLKSGKASGVIMHKIDRSARNLHDWASVGDLIDNGIQVHFAHESLDMTERGGRLSADIQAVMASDYVRNLKQEIRKGINGRLNSGIYPFGAPVGYVNNGKGQLKTIDYNKSPLIKTAFELYLTGKFNMRSLSKKISELGLRNHNNKPICKNGLTRILNNPFYIGLMKVKDKLYEGNHEPLIKIEVFQEVQLMLKSRTTSSGLKHFYKFRRLLKCGYCNYKMPGEYQKGNIYYRCQTKNCPTKTIREDSIENQIKKYIGKIALTEAENDMLVENAMNDYSFDETQSKMASIRIKKDIESIQIKEDKLLDMLLEDRIESNGYESKRDKLLLQKIKLKEEYNESIKSKTSISNRLLNFLELCRNTVNTYEKALSEQKRELVKITTSNLTVFGKKLEILPSEPFSIIANRHFLLSSAHTKDINRINSTQNYPLEGKFIYTSDNTSPIIHKPLTNSELNNLLELIKQNINELPTNNPSS